MYRYLIIIEKGDSGYGAYAPDIPGCVAVGDTLEEVEREMRAALVMHLQAMREDHDPISGPRSTAEYVEFSLSEPVK
ncbi:MAG: type II toxin-antitoxin system HicB family antitoxin [Ktedonobacterales bacterium]